eukprot:g23101.t1
MFVEICLFFSWPGSSKEENHELRLSPGERGCGASHLHLWRRCAASHVPSLILEDDAQLKRTFAGALSQALAELRSCRPQVLYLGYTQAAPWRRRIGPSVREAEYLWTTVAYVLWPSGARRLLEELPVDQPVDNFMSQLMARKKLRGFATVPPLVKQSKAWNVDNDVAHSDDQAHRFFVKAYLTLSLAEVFSLDTELHVTVWNHAAAQSFDMDEFAVAVLSYGSTILFATLGAALAMRLFREVLRPARSRDELPDVVQMDIPGVQPFRPFAGQGYHLQADLGKPPDPPKPAEDEMTGSGVLALD